MSGPFASREHDLIAEHAAAILATRGNELTNGFTRATIVNGKPTGVERKDIIAAMALLAPLRMVDAFAAARESLPGFMEGGTLQRCTAQITRMLCTRLGGDDAAMADFSHAFHPERRHDTGFIFEKFGYADKIRAGDIMLASPAVIVAFAASLTVFRDYFSALHQAVAAAADPACPRQNGIVHAAAIMEAAFATPEMTETMVAGPLTYTCLLQHHRCLEQGARAGDFTEADFSHANATWIQSGLFRHASHAGKTLSRCPFSRLFSGIAGMITDRGGSHIHSLRNGDRLWRYYRMALDLPPAQTAAIQRDLYAVLSETAFQIEERTAIRPHLPGLSGYSPRMVAPR